MQSNVYTCSLFTSKQCIYCVFAEENKPIWMQAEEINVSY